MAEPTVKILLSIQEESDASLYSVDESRTTLEIKSGSSYWFNEVFDPACNPPEVLPLGCGHMLKRLLSGHNLIVIVSNYVDSPSFAVRITEEIFKKTKGQETTVSLNVLEVENNFAKERGEIQVHSTDNVLSHLFPPENATSHLLYTFRIVISNKRTGIKTGNLTVLHTATESTNSAVIEDISILQNMILAIQLDQPVQPKSSKIGQILQTFITGTTNLAYILCAKITNSTLKQSVRNIEYAQSVMCVHSRPKETLQGTYMTPYQSEKFRKLQDEVRSFSKKIEKKKYLHHFALEKLSHLVSIADIGSLKSPKVVSAAEQFKEAVPKQSTLTDINRKLRAKAEKIEKMVRDQETNDKFVIRSFSEQISSLEREIAEVSISLNKLKTTEAKEPEELQKMVAESHRQMEQKAETIYNLPFVLKCKAADIRNSVDQHSEGAEAVKITLRASYKQKEEAHSKHISELSKAFEEQMNLKMQQGISYDLQCCEYLRRKDTDIWEIKKECQELYKVFTKTDGVIRDLEKGVFQLLKSEGLLTSRNDGKYIQLSKHRFTDKYRTIMHRQAVHPPPTRSFTVHRRVSNSVPVQLDETPMAHMKEQILELQKALDNTYKELRRINGRSRTLEQSVGHLKATASKESQHRERIRKSVDYELKHQQGSQVVIESQKRILEKFFFVTDGNYRIRPATSSTNNR